ncbi:TRAP transporter small permease [Robertmurraya massiliosenegalensis]|uniref:TRAP transporter small permease n=1 Tax=Robertmurraya TaxID=2837507 RepID=UPI0039A7291B
MKKAFLWLDKHLEEVFMVVFLALIVILMTVQVFMRYVLGNSLSWSDELIRYAFIWFVFLGIGYGIRTQSHLKIDILEIAVPSFKKMLIAIQDIFIFLFCVYMILPSVNGINLLISTGQTSPALGIDMYIVYLSLLIGFVLAMFRLIQKYILIIIKRKVV